MENKEFNLRNFLYNNPLLEGEDKKEGKMSVSCSNYDCIDVRFDLDDSIITLNIPKMMQALNKTLIDHREEFTMKSKNKLIEKECDEKKDLKVSVDKIDSYLEGGVKT